MSRSKWLALKYLLLYSVTFLQTIVRSSPDLLYSVCLIELPVVGQIRVRGGYTEGYGSLTIFDMNTDAVFVADLTLQDVSVSKSAKDKVIAGTLNGDGGFVMEAKALGYETVLARIVAIVASASRSRAPLQRIADRASRIFVP